MNYRSAQIGYGPNHKFYLLYVMLEQRYNLFDEN